MNAPNNSTFNSCRTIFWDIRKPKGNKKKMNLLYYGKNVLRINFQRKHIWQKAQFNISKNNVNKVQSIDLSNKGRLGYEKIFFF